MTLNAVPSSYPQMLVFLFKGSGIWAMLIVTVCAVVYKSTVGNWFWWDVTLIAMFYLGRGIVEWTIHSWLYHANPLPFVGWKLTSGTSVQHIEHHKNPHDISRLLITYKGVLSLSLITFIGSLALFQNLDIAATMTLSLMVIGFMIEIVHLVCHCEIPHKSKAIKKLVSLHRHHHQIDGQNYYGVSSSLGDQIFGTYPRSHKR